MLNIIGTALNSSQKIDFLMFCHSNAFVIIAWPFCRQARAIIYINLVVCMTMVLYSKAQSTLPLTCELLISLCSSNLLQQISNSLDFCSILSYSDQTTRSPRGWLADQTTGCKRGWVTWISGSHLSLFPRLPTIYIYSSLGRRHSCCKYNTLPSTGWS